MGKQQTANSMDWKRTRSNGKAYKIQKNSPGLPFTVTKGPEVYFCSFRKIPQCQLEVGGLREKTGFVGCERKQVKI